MCTQYNLFISNVSVVIVGRIKVCRRPYFGESCFMISLCLQTIEISGSFYNTIEVVFLTVLSVVFQ